MNYLESKVRQFNGVRSFANLIATVIKTIRALLIGMLVIGAWAVVRPDQPLEQFLLGFTVFLLILVFALRARRHKITQDDLLLICDMKYGNLPDVELLRTSALEGAPERWSEVVKRELWALKIYERKRLLGLSSTLLIPIMLALVSLPKTAPSIETAISEVKAAAESLTWGAQMEVKEGLASETEKNTMTLKSGVVHKINLLERNLVEIRVKTSRGLRNPPTVELKKLLEAESITDANGDEVELPLESDGPQDPVLVEDQKPFQAFQLIPRTRNSGENFLEYFISFAITENSNLYLPHISREHLASIFVQKLPVPVVSLSVTDEIEEPWPDDQPLNLKIKVKAKNPLQIVNLLIRSGERTSRELVANVMTEDKHRIETVYQLILEPYLGSDLAQVEIIAEAIDRSVPTPLVGRSQSLIINTASAYGRYRNTLSTLREIKTLVDQSIKEDGRSIDPMAQSLAAKASQQSENSPFFDGLDRFKIHEFDSALTDIELLPTTEKMLDLSDSLNNFLFEHEILDDRERDRDFFVAARGLSRLLEQDYDRRDISANTVTTRIKQFLQGRQERWEIRVQRLNAEVPKTWSHIKRHKPFQKAMSKIADLDNQKSRKATSEQMKELSQTVVEYRAWIDELESIEDKVRTEQEQQRQEGLANARNVLKELQSRQGEISRELDKAHARAKAELQENWPSVRMKQKTNIKETKRLENQLRSLAPSAGERIKGALDAMNYTEEQGEASEFINAESGSDLASRLLRQADSAARNSQAQRRRGGRRRRVTGDNYYGRSVVGGDIEIRREYQVDRRYREDILDEVISSGVEKGQQTLLENYLRQVVR